VEVGRLCVDTYEASVWEIPATNAALIDKVQHGTATLADLQAGNGVVQRGTNRTDDYPCGDDGNDCSDLYAVSIPGVQPSISNTWFQAQQACANVGKRLLTNAEWQMAAAGTPAPDIDNGSTACNIITAGTAVNTGSRANCQSRWGTFDMVGNVGEWVADRVAAPTTCPGWGSFSNDKMCLAGADASIIGPAALVRGGDFHSSSEAGVFEVNWDQPWHSSYFSGFRCSR